MEQNCNPQFVVQHTVPAGHRPGTGPAGNGPAAKNIQYGTEVGQAGQRVAQDGLKKGGLSKAALCGCKAGYKLGRSVPSCYNCGWMGHLAKECIALRAQVQAAHTAAVESNAAGELEELIDDEEAPQKVEEQSKVDDAESVHINRDKYVLVDMYDNDYYAHNDKEEHLFALTEHQEDRHVCMQCVILQKAADKLQ
ncbi:hypothetical protein J132_05091 [Termitomyces sp. J132]|nr:hypothetical protein J132_05091 [Termitomyces sp. J132]